MVLLIEYFKSKNAKRYEEYLKCIKNNIDSGIFDKIVVFAEDNTFPFVSNIVKIERVNKRPTYKNIFNYCNSNFEENEICVISNTDIYFDKTINYVNVDNLTNRFICLTRYDVLPNGGVSFFNQNGISTLSQDTWIFKTPIKINGGGYLMGKPGCDNKIALEALNSGYIVNNPSLAIKTYHIHNTGYRTYNRNDSVGGPYIGVSPCISVLQKSEYKKFG